MPKLAEVIDALTSNDSERYFYDRETDEIVLVFDDDISAAEEFSEGDDLEEAASRTASGDVEFLRLALRIIHAEPGAFVPLPTAWDVHMHAIMVDFAGTLPEPKAQDLQDKLHGRGAFRRFKNAIHDLDVVDAWYAYQNERLTEIAREWAGDCDIPLVLP